jgi:CheY-like chemotaxis protein
MPTHTLSPLLIAEDDPHDMFLFTRLLTAAGAVNALHIALDGQDAMRLLSPVVKKSRLVVKPAAVFLDAKMPRVDGLAVLEWMRAQRELDDVPAIMLSGNPDPEAISRATTLGAQCFLTKYPGKLTVVRVLQQAAQFSANPRRAAFDTPDNLLRRTTS